MNLKPLLRQLKLVAKDGSVRNLDLESDFSWAQRDFVQRWEYEYESGRAARFIVLKARQLGISTVVQGILFSYSFIFDNHRGLVVAHEQDSSEHLLSMTDFYWENYPYRPLYTVKYASKKEKEWVETHSGIRVATAKNARTGRSRTLRFLHASEVAFWDTPETTMLGLRQAIPNIPGTAIVLESTANGVGNYFQRQWKAAEAGDSEFIPIFYPWHLHPEYTASAINLEDGFLGTLSEEERTLRGMGIGEDRLLWRRYAIKNLCDSDIEQFHQEYPTTPEEAFITTGHNVFPHDNLTAVYEPMEGKPGRLMRDGARVIFVPDSRGPLRVFKEPSPDRDWGVYIIGADPTHSTRGDYAVAQVISRRTMEQVAVLRIRIDPSSFAEEIARLGQFYNEALVAPETEGPGYATIGYLQGISYPYIWHNQLPDRTPGKMTGDIWGWRTTAQSKHHAIGQLLKVVVDGSITIHDKFTYQEMRDYVTLENGGYGPADGSEHDDTVMALAIGTTAQMMEPPLPAYGQTFTPEEEPPDLDPAWMSWDEQMEQV